MQLFYIQSLDYIGQDYLQIISVSMDFKRNYTSNIQPPTQIKANPLITPLINISNASTPVRTRIVKPGSQLNSTPVNVHKIGIPAKSPALSNKQNDEGNCKLVFKKHELPKQNINLSPIMALNRKMSEGPNKIMEQRSLTPTGPSGFKRQQSVANIHESGDNHFFRNDQGFGQALRQSRSSNGFKCVLESRSKTPTRTAFAETLQRQSGQGNALIGAGLRTSGSAHTLLQGISPKMKDSRTVKLGQSRSFEQLISIGTPGGKTNDVLCSNSNDHDKKVKAKYKVVEEPDDDQILVYCSKCAINLVQKGFKVEDLTNQDIEKIKRNQQRRNEYGNQQSNQYYEYAEETSRKIKLKLNELMSQKENLVSAYQRELDNVECYYNSILSMVEQQKRKDKQTILRYLQKEKKPGEALERRIADASNQLGSMIRNGQVGHQQLNIIQQIQSLLTEKGFSQRFDNSLHLADNVEYKFDHFTRFFQSEGKLRIQGEENNNGYHGMPPQQQYFSNKDTKSGRDNSLRFSFQKHLNQSKRNNQFAFRTGIMNPLQEAPQAMEGQDSNEMSKDYQNANEKKAFRTLFPEDEEQGDYNEGQKQTIHSPTFKQI